MMKTAIVPALALALVLALPMAARAFESGDVTQAQGPTDRPPLASPLTPTNPRPGNPRAPNRAREAVRRGEILSLETVTQRVQRSHPGRLLDAQFEDGRRGPVYHLKMLTRDGRVLQLAVDARTAQVLGVSRR